MIGDHGRGGGCSADVDRLFWFRISCLGFGLRRSKARGVPDSLTLVFETSSPAASILLAGAGGVLSERVFTSDRSHNALLFGPLSEVLQGIGLERIGLILVGSGPGSYSGTRVGLAAAQGVGLAADCPVVAVPSVIAAPSVAEVDCLVVGDARRGSYWTSLAGPGGLVLPPTLTDEAGFQSAVERAGCVVSFEDRERSPFPTGRPIRFEVPTARLLWQAWSSADEGSRQSWAAAAPQPHYLRPPHVTESKRAWPVAKRGPVSQRPRRSS